MLEQILKQKEQEIQLLLSKHTKKQPAITVKRPSLIKAFQERSFNVIAEIKRKSPSAGTLATIRDPVALAIQYEAGGACGISVLTDQHFFNGPIEDLKKVSQAVDVPILRKDFIIHPMQIEETVQAGASAVLLIVAALGDQTNEMLKKVHEAGLEALVEIHNKEELEIALKANARLIGVNSRNLKTMKVNLATAEDLIKAIPDHIIKIAESGIHSIDDAKRMKNAGYQGVLVGEMLVRSLTPATIIHQMRKL